MLSHLSVDEFLNAVRTDSEEKIRKINGIGPAKAKKIIFEIKARLDKIEALLGKGSRVTEITPDGSVRLDAIMALHENLGFDLKKSTRMVEDILSIHTDWKVEQVIREVLTRISG